MIGLTSAQTARVLFNAAKAAGTLRLLDFNPDQPRDEHGRWSDGDSFPEGLTKISEARGSNPGGVYRDKDGQKWYVKNYKNAEQAANENIANAVYKAIGIDVPTSTLSDDGKRIALKWEESQGTLGQIGLDREVANKILDGFAADVFLQNWDAVGTGHDNVILQGKKPIRVDQGGTLLFRAQGAPKPEATLHEIGEWTSLKDSNTYYAAVFREAGVRNADALGSRAVQQIDKIIAARPSGGWGQIVEKAAGSAGTKFKERVTNMLEARYSKLVAKRDELRLRGAAFNADQPRDEHGRWTGGGESFYRIDRANNLFDVVSDRTAYLEDFKQVPEARREMAVERTMDITNVASSQKSVEVSQVQELIDDPSLADNSEDGPPLLLRWRGQTVIGDGHHRIAAALLRGEKKMHVEYVDLDAYLRKIRAAAFNADQPRDEKGRWIGTGTSWKTGNPKPEVLNDVPLEAAAGPDLSGVNNSIEEPPFPDLPKNKHAAAGLIMVEPDGGVWMVHPWKNYGGYRTTFPKGTVDEGESLQETALREAFEETGLTGKITGHLADVERTTSVTRFYIGERTGGAPWAAGKETYAVRLAPVEDEKTDKLLRNVWGRKTTDHDVLAAVRNRLGLKAAEFNPDQPRDGHGRWAPAATIADLEKKYPEAGDYVSGNLVHGYASNMGSIEASLGSDYEILSGIREVPISAFENADHPKFYSKTEQDRTEDLASEIEISRSITPLIVVVDAKGPYILEGGHRFDALKINKTKSFPAVVVVDTSEVSLRAAGFNPMQPRDQFGKWTDSEGGGGSSSTDLPKPKKAPKAPPVPLESKKAAYDEVKSGATFKKTAEKYGMTQGQLAGYVWKVDQAKKKVDQALEEQQLISSIEKVSPTSVETSTAPSATPTAAPAAPTAPVVPTKDWNKLTQDEKVTYAHETGHQWKPKPESKSGNYAWYDKNNVQVSGFGPKDAYKEKLNTLYHGEGIQPPPPPNPKASGPAGPWPIGDDVTRQLGKNYEKTVYANYSNWEKGLNSNEQSAISSYTGSGYGPINSYLRSSSGSGETYAKKQAESIESALKKAPEPPPPELVWRGLSGSYGPKLMSSLNKDDVITMKGIQSTTISPPFAKNWGSGNVFEIKPSKGAYIKHLSGHPSEFEYILPHNAKYRVRGTREVSISDGYGDKSKMKVVQLEML